MTDMQIFVTILLSALVTAAVRFAPFLLFPQGKQAPAFINWLGKRLPWAVMAMLVVYCLKDISFAATGAWLPSLLAVAATVAMHVWKRQISLSIVGGTAVYMVLIRLLS